MATAFDELFLASAQSILSKFGVPATLSREVSSGYNPLTMEVTETVTTINIEKASPPIQYSKEEYDTDLVQLNDFKVIVSRSDSLTSVDNHDKITINGITADIVNVKPVYSGAEIAIWILQCRRG